nr:uncharacterized protein LOC126525225 [Dermacentor andersoni]
MATVRGEHPSGVNSSVPCDVNLPILLHAAVSKLNKPGASGLRHVCATVARADDVRTVMENNTEVVVTEEEEPPQGTETDTPDTDWIPAAEEAKKLVADPVQVPASRKGRRATFHHSVGAGRNHRLIAAKSARHAAPRSHLPAWRRSPTRRPTIATPM